MSDNEAQSSEGRVPTLVDPRIETLLAKVGGSKFSLVTVASRRAREINEYFTGMGAGHGTIFPPQVRSKSNKSLSIALEELYQDKLVVRRVSAEELALEDLAREAGGAEEASGELDAFSEALRNA